MALTFKRPEKWDIDDPWTSLALAVALQAYQDVIRGARYARRILRGDPMSSNLRETFVEVGAVSAALFFKESTVWRILTGRTENWVPKPIAEEVNVILEAERYWRARRARKRGAAHEQGAATGG